MNHLLASKLEQIKTLCHAHGVKSLHLFGSAARDDFDPARSDLDFLVEFVPMPPNQRARAFFALERELTKLFDRPVDLGEVEAIRNPHLYAAINQSRVLLYDAA